MLPFILSLALLLPTYNLAGPGYNAFITPVYDADTLTVVFQPSPVTSAWVTERIRLFDVANQQGANSLSD